jgi:hypothetical protein
MRDCCRLRCYTPQTNATQHKKPPQYFRVALVPPQCDTSQGHAIRKLAQAQCCGMKQCRRVRQLARTRFVFPVRRLTADRESRGEGKAREPITFVRQCYHKATGSLVANMSAEANLLGAGLSHTPDRCRYRTLHRMTRTMPARGAQFAKWPRVRSRASLVSTNIHQRSDRLSLSDMCYPFDSRVNSSTPALTQTARITRIKCAGRTRTRSMRHSGFWLRLRRCCHRR